MYVYRVHTYLVDGGSFACLTRMCPPQMLRWVKGYTKQKTMILPPLEPGCRLPFEISDAYLKEHPHSRSEQPVVGAVSTAALIEEEEGSHTSLARTSSQCISKPSMVTPKGSITEVEEGQGERGGGGTGGGGGGGGGGGEEAECEDQWSGSGRTGEHACCGCHCTLHGH